MATSKLKKRQEIAILQASLENEQSSFKVHWRDLADYILPRRAQFTLSQTNRGERRNQKIINATATLAARTLASGMMGGVTSPARDWYRLSTPDPALSENGQVKIYLHEVTKRMNAVFLKSNLYKALPNLYGDMGTFATAAMMVEEDFEDVARFYTFPIGSYKIALDDKGRVRVFSREFRQTVRQLTKKFGVRDENGNLNTSNFSESVKTAINRNQWDQWVDVCHIIRPNEDFNPKSLTSKLFESIYFEKGTVTATAGASSVSDVYLRERGYDYFPVLCPRWETTGEDIYGTNCPGMTALGDIKSLQVMEKRSAQAIEKMVNPPMIGPSALKRSKASILPGDITYLDEREGTKGFRPAHEVNFRIGELEEKMRQKENLIRRAFYEDLFLMLANDTRRQPVTAREIDERHEEKLLALGPVLEQLNQDLLDPLIDIVFDLMSRQNLLPEPPEELQGQTLKVEYISIMHQAQKIAGLAGIERFAGFVGDMASFIPDVLDKIDADQTVDEVAEIMGVPPAIVVDDETVAIKRQARAEAEAAAAEAEKVAANAGAAKDLSQASLEGDSALSRLLEQSEAGAVQ